MKKSLEYILKNILDGEVEITETEEDGFTTYFVNAQQDQIGKLIGKGGKTIHAIKQLLKIQAIKDDKRIDIQISEA